VPEPFGRAPSHLLRTGDTPACPRCGSASVTFVAFFEDLSRFLMRCICGHSFVLMMADETPAASREDRVRAMIVDPHEDTRELYKEVLMFGGFDVVAAATAREALQSAFMSRPSVISIELRLPDGDGLELCRHFKKSKETSAIPIFVVTGETRSERLAKARRMADAVVVKPCSPASYLTHVLHLSGLHAAPRRR